MGRESNEAQFLSGFNKTTFYVLDHPVKLLDSQDGPMKAVSNADIEEYKRQSEWIKEDKTDARTVALDALDFSKDDLFVSKCQKERTFELLGRNAATLYEYGRAEDRHWHPDAAYHLLERSARIVKRCLGADSRLAKSIESEMRAMEHPDRAELSKRYRVTEPKLPPWPKALKSAK